MGDQIFQSMEYVIEAWEEDGGGGEKKNVNEPRGGESDGSRGEA